jgi:inorganic pyrophosphatase
MVNEVQRQYEELDLANNLDNKPEYQKCVAISTEASLREMIAPGVLVMATPLITGYGFGVEALAGMLCGILASGVQVAISASNTGGAWDNAKKYVESGGLKKYGSGFGKGTDTHNAAVVGDTVGDPLKDTSGPSINILIKLSAITSLVFAPSFPALADGGYLVQALGLN